MKNIDVKKLGTATVIVDIVKKGNKEIRPATAMNPTQIAVHNTGNAGRGAGAKSHNTYIHNMAGKTPAQTGYASWHFSVDDKFIYQHIPMDECAWHTGDGTGANSGNKKAIGIEICENPETNTKQAEENAIALMVYLMDKLNINVQNVKPHQAYSGKYCPRVILGRDGSFTKFHNRVKAAMGKPVVAVPSAPAAKPVASTEGIVAYMNRVGLDSSYANRAKLAKAHGIANYKGTAAQNTSLLAKLQAPKPVKQLIGKVTVDVWSQRNAFYLNTGRVKVLEKGTEWKVHGEKDGFYNLGSEWVNKKYMKLI